MRHAFDYIKKYKFLLLVILPAFFLYMLIIFPSGTFLCFKDACGINFWGVHGHDAIWHLAIANVSFNKFPFVAPTFSGENLYGYNYLFDFFIYLLSRLGIPSLFSYFKLLPIIWFILFTLLLIVLARKIKDSSLFVSFFLFFNYFAGSFSYFLTLYHHKTINGSSTLLPQPIMHAMSNLPFAFSLLFFLALLIFIKDKKMDTKKLLIIGTIIFIILGLKFYGGVIAIFMVFTYVILVSPATGGAHPESNYDSGVVTRRNIGVLPRMTKSLVIISVFVLLGIFFFYDPIRSLKTGSVFGWAPFALVHTITETPNQFYLQNMTDARYFLQQFGIGPRLVAIETLNLLIFLFFYLGTRFFGLIYLGILFLKKQLDKFDAVVILTIGFSILLTGTLVQKAEWWNTIQFFFYAIFLSTIYLTKLTYDLFAKKKMILILVSLLIIFLSMPTSYDLIRQFLVVPGATYLPIEEAKALDFLNNQPDGVVLTPLYKKEWKNYQKPNPLYRYEDTAYVAAFSGKTVYFANLLQLRLTGVYYEQRLKKMQVMDCSMIKEVDYIYEIRELSDKEKINIKCNSKNIKTIFSNGKIIIYKLD